MRWAQRFRESQRDSLNLQGRFGGDSPGLVLGKPGSASGTSVHQQRLAECLFVLPLFRSQLPALLSGPRPRAVENELLPS